MKFSKMCDYKDVPHFIVKTGRKNIRILKPGEPYEKSFVVPIKKISNRRPAEYEPEDDDVQAEDETELVDASEAIEDEQYQPQ